MISVLIFYSSGKLVGDSMNILFEGVPSHIDVRELGRRIVEVKGMESVHNLHVWCIAPTKMCCMSGHVVMKKGTNRRKLITTLINLSKEEFGIGHTTNQLEDEGYPKVASEHWKLCQCS